MKDKLKLETWQWSEWFDAAKENNIKTLKYYINIGVDIDSTDDGGNSALCIASCFGNLESAKLLIKNGADVNFRTMYTYTPLSYSCNNGHAEIVKLLIDNDVDVNVLDDGKAAPIFYVILKGQSDEIIKLLIKAGADIPEYFWTEYSHDKYEIQECIVKYQPHEIKNMIKYTEDEYLKDIMEDYSDEINHYLQMGDIGLF
ncbi:ankyrin repeat domain-containing protein [bacterium]|jgi:ankyrin repeat protein|nr:ankyrin repeat domain-containing protein [bacterium]